MCFWRSAEYFSRLFIDFMVYEIKIYEPDEHWNKNPGSTWLLFYLYLYFYFFPIIVFCDFLQRMGQVSNYGRNLGPCLPYLWLSLLFSFKTFLAFYFETIMSSQEVSKICTWRPYVPFNQSLPISKIFNILPHYTIKTRTLTLV